MRSWPRFSPGYPASAPLTEPRLSIVVPAWNEAAFIGDTVRALKTAASDSGNSDAEIIVADDGSTDGTGALALEAGARVVPAGKRNIAAARNAGARQARGEILLFVDADTRPGAPALAAAVAAVEAGAIGGGAVLEWDEPVDLAGTVAIAAWNLISRVFRLPAGGFLFMRRAAWQEVGGFPEELFISEEIAMAARLRRRGRLVILAKPVVTSARKLRLFSVAYFVRFLARLMMRPRSTIRDRGALDIWYRR